MSELQPLKTGSYTWQVSVSTQGKFSGHTTGLADIYADSYQALKDLAKVKASQSKVSVEVPYVRFTYTARGGNPTAVSGIATGIHGSNGNVLTRENGKSGQLTYYAHDEHYIPFSEDDEKRYLVIMATQKALNAEKSALQQKYKFKNGLTKVVQAAVEEAVKAMAETQEGTEDQ